MTLQKSVPLIVLLIAAIFAGICLSEASPPNVPTSSAPALLEQVAEPLAVQRDLPQRELVTTEPDQPAQPIAVVGGPARITGRIVDSMGRPIPGVVAMLKCNESNSRSAPSDLKGELHFESSAFGKNAIVLIDESTVPQGYLPPWRQEQPSIATKSPNFPLGFHASEVVIPPPGEERQVILRLFLNGSGWGQVVTVSGVPVPNANVRLQSRIAGLNGLDMAAKTDEAGYYGIEKLYPGKFRMEIDLAGCPTQFRSLAAPIPENVDLSEGASQQLPIIVIGGGSSSVRGVVVNQDGMPYPGLEVICFPKAPVQSEEIPFTWNSSVASATTDSTGRFVLTTLPAYTYGVFVGRNAFDISDPVGTLADGTKKLAYWKDVIEVDTRVNSAVDLGTISAVESRPFHFSGRILPTAEFSGKLSELRVDVELHDPAVSSSSSKLALSAPRTVRVNDDGTFEWRCNTPHPAVKLTVRGRKQHGQSLLTLYPNEKSGKESQEIVFPQIR